MENPIEMDWGSFRFRKSLLKWKDHAQMPRGSPVIQQQKQQKLRCWIYKTDESNSKSWGVNP